MTHLTPNQSTLCPSNLTAYEAQWAGHSFAILDRETVVQVSFVNMFTSYRWSEETVRTLVVD